MSAHGGGSERWLVSYADFITVLMALFIVMFAIGNVDIAKYKALAESLKAALGGEGGPSSVVSAGIDAGGGLSPADKNALPAPISISGIPSKPMSASDVAIKLSDMVSGTGVGGAVSVQNNIEGIFISMSEKITFERGTANLTPAAYPVLDEIINVVKPMENTIRVVGHTDDSPSTDTRYPTNWELSIGRALAVVNYMQEAGIPGHRLVVSGRGQYEPLFPNDTDEHRALNSRVEINVVFKVEDDVLQLPGANPQP